MENTVYFVFYTDPSNMIKNGGHGRSDLCQIFDSLQKARDFIAEEKELIAGYILDDVEEGDEEYKYKNDLMTLSFEIVETVLM